MAGIGRGPEAIPINEDVIDIQAWSRAPVATPAPTAATATAEDRSHRDAHAERDGAGGDNRLQGRRRINDRRIWSIHRSRPEDVNRVVARNIDHFRTGRLYYDYLCSLDFLHLHRLLGVRL
jgi:hypothetical protein